MKNFVYIHLRILCIGISLAVPGCSKVDNDNSKQFWFPLVHPANHQLNIPGLNLSDNPDSSGNGSEGRDPFARRDRALQIQAQDERGRVELETAIVRMRILGLSSPNGLEVINADLDEDTNSLHVRFRQTYNGIPVRHATLITHRKSDGSYEQDTDYLQRGIQVSTEPRFSVDRAVEVVAAQPDQIAPWSGTPKTTLQILPIQGPKISEDTRDSDYGAPDAIPEIIESEAKRRILGYRLVWSVRTMEGAEGSGRQNRAMETLIDAQSGGLISQEDLSSDETGIGHGFFAGEVNDLQTIDFSSTGIFMMCDKFREYCTWDDDYPWAFSLADTSIATFDGNNIWGNGVLFPSGGGNTGSKTLRQTAMVDLHHHSRVNWDMLSNIYKRQGPDDHFYSVHQWAHGTPTNFPKASASYSRGSGNITYADGAEWVALNGHEHGHAFDDFTSGGMSGAEVKESIADISGLLTRIYNECCFKAQLNKFPETLPHNDSEDPFTNPFADFRDMVQPGRKGNPNYYFSGIPDMEVHKAGTPNNHAFYFLSQGASHWMDSADHSAFLPWGMEGIGFRKAAGLYYRAVVSYLPDDGDYYAVFSAMTGAAFLKYDGINSPEYKAVRHAYHGININDPIINAAIPDNYPAPQKILITSNQFLSTSSLPSQPNITIPHISLKPNKAPEKLWLSVTGPNSHTFAFNVPQNHKYVVRLHSIVGKNSFRVNENNNQLMDTVSAKKGAYKLFAGFGNPIVFSGKSLLQVTTWADDSTPSDNKYVLAIDVQQCKYLNADAVTNSFFCQ